MKRKYKKDNSRLIKIRTKNIMRIISITPKTLCYISNNEVSIGYQCEMRRI